MSKYRNQSESDFNLTIESAKQSAGAMWVNFTSAAISAIDHCKRHTFSPDRINKVYAAMAEADVGDTMMRAYQKALWNTCAIKIRIKDGEVQSDPYNKEQWAKIQASDLDSLEVLESADNALKKFKPAPAKKGSAKNPVTGKDKYHVVSNEVADLMTKIGKADPDNQVIADLLSKLDAVKAQLEKEYKRLEPKILAKTMAPANEESAIDSLAS